MNTRTQEAIEFINGIKHSGNGYGNSYISDFNKFKDIVTLLQQGEKYRQMWEEFKIYNSEVDEYIEAEYMLAQMKNVEQKYFPKEMIL